MAQQTVGKLNIVISATTGQLTSALAQAQTKVNAFSLNATRMPEVLKKTAANATNLVNALAASGGLSGALKAVTTEAAFLGSVSGNLVVAGAALATQFGVSVYDAFQKSKQAAKDAAEAYRQATIAAQEAVIAGAGPAGITAPEAPKAFDVQRIFELPGLRQQKATAEARIKARQEREVEIRRLKELLVKLRTTRSDEAGPDLAGLFGLAGVGVFAKQRTARTPEIVARINELGRGQGGGVEDLVQRGVAQGKIQEIADGLLSAIGASIRSRAGQAKESVGEVLSKTFAPLTGTFRDMLEELRELNSDSKTVRIAN